MKRMSKKNSLKFGKLHLVVQIDQQFNLHSVHRSALAPNGYAIAAFPWYIDQSIGGAVSTGNEAVVKAGFY